MMAVFVGGPLNGEKQIVPECAHYSVTTSPRLGVYVHHRYEFHPIAIGVNGETRFFVGVYEKLTLPQVMERLFGDAIRRNFA